MPRGAKPGERRGGRVKGVPNKATIEKAKIAELTVVEARAVGKRLAKKLLEDFALRFAEIAAHYQPALPGAKPNQYENEEKFYKNAELAIDCAHKLAPYQSPTFRAVVVAPVPEMQSSNDSVTVDQLRTEILVEMKELGLLPLDGIEARLLSIDSGCRRTTSNHRLRAPCASTSGPTTSSPK